MNKFYKLLIQQKEDGNNGSFNVEENGRVKAEMTCSMKGSNLVFIDQPEVSDE